MYNYFMKKFLITLLLLITIAPLSDAAEYMPSSTKSIPPASIGVCAAPVASFLYQKSDTNSSLKEIIKIINGDIKTLRVPLSPQSSFISFVPKKDIFYFIAKDENDKWCNVVYNKTTGEAGWVEKPSEDAFLTWKEFLYKYGKENGVYFLSDVPANLRILRTSPNETAQSVKDCINPSNISLITINGNWMLVRILDFGGEVKIGWTRWRGNNGEIYVFPLISGN